MASAYFLISSVLLLLTLLIVAGSRQVRFGRLLVVAVLLYGITIKPLFVVLELPSADFIADFVLYPLTEQQYWSGSTFLLAYYGLFLLAMIAAGRTLAHVRVRPAALEIERFRLGRVVFVLGVGLLGMLAFFYQNPDLLTGASKNVLAADDVASYQGSGISRTLCSALYFVPFLMLVNVRNNYRRKASLLVLWIAALAWLGFNFLADQRGGMLFATVSWLIAYAGFIGPVRFRYLFALGVVVGAMVLVRTALRIASGAEGALASLDQVLGNYIGRNFVENAKTLIIMDAVPQSLPQMYGSSYLDSLLILVPRALLPDKQTVNLDTIIGISVFDCDAIGACGVPPGLIAESFVNFGFGGIVVMLVIAGVVTAWLDWRATGGGSWYRIFYASSLVYFGMAALGSGISSFTTQLIMSALVLTFAYYVSLSRGRFVEPQPQSPGRGARAAPA
ncbi:MAG: O-antigen polymerase [Steroidobacteraceae bacterium]